MASKQPTNGSPAKRTALLRQLSTLVERSQFAQRYGLTFQGADGLFKRDIYSALGYSKKLEAKDYRSRYERGGIAERIVEAYPRATWSGGARIQENPDPGVETPFEVAARELFERLDVWARLLRLDILAGIGHYGVLLIGAQGELTAELPDLTAGVDPLFLVPLSEERASIKSFEKDATSPRFGLPTLYQVKTGSEAFATKDVHWSRVIHVAEGMLEDDVVGKPKLRAVWNYLDDLEKLVGGGAEAAWKRMDPGVHFDINPEAELSEPEIAAMQEQLDEYTHQLRRNFTTVGTKVTPLAAQVAAFNQNVESVVQLISATTGIPHRILTGSERGELASTQDRNNWNDRVAERRREFAVPLLNMLLRRLINRGALPEPKQIDVAWPEIDELDEDTKATVALKFAQANQANAAAGGGLIVVADEIRQNVLDLDPLEDVEGDEDEKAAEEAALRAASDLADRDATEPEWKAVHRAADAHRASLARALAGVWRDAAEGIDGATLERVLENGALHPAELMVVAAVKRAEDEFAEMLPDRLLAVLVDGGMAAVRSVRARGSFFRAAQAEPRGLFEASFDQANERAIEWAATRSSELIVEIGAETRQAVRALIAEGITEGIAPRKLVKQIRGVVGLRSDQVRALQNFAERLRDAGASESSIERQATRYAAKLRRDRALLIARTETMRASGEGQRELWRQAQESGELPQDLQRVWITTPDGRLCPQCSPLDGEIAGLDGLFAGLTDGPPLHPACRCATGIASAEDVQRAQGSGRVAA